MQCRESMAGPESHTESPVEQGGPVVQSKRTLLFPTLGGKNQLEAVNCQMDSLNTEPSAGQAHAV